LETAVGLIMGTGNVGPYLRFEKDEVNTYLSRDGGLTWIEAHKGAYIYEFGDHGGLVVMADDIQKTRQVVFSWNEGHSWYDFDVSEHSMAVDNIVTEPTSTSTKFLMHGTRSDAGKPLTRQGSSKLYLPDPAGIFLARIGMGTYRPKLVDFS
ncbi:Sorl1p, partial [Perkinsus olseni]